jgi:hypothetical protein
MQPRVKAYGHKLLVSAINKSYFGGLSRLQSKGTNEGIGKLYLKGSFYQHTHKPLN